MDRNAFSGYDDGQDWRLACLWHKEFEFDDDVDGRCSAMFSEKQQG